MAPLTKSTSSNRRAKPLAFTAWLWFRLKDTPQESVSQPVGGKVHPECINAFDTIATTSFGGTQDAGTVVTGQFVARWGAIVLLTAVVLAAGAAIGLRAAAERSPRATRFAASLTPRVLRTWAVARFAQNLADLLRAGVPAVEALRVLSTTLPMALNRVVMQAAAEVEQGGDLAEALGDPAWFTPQFRRLLHSGQAAGELEATLERMAQRDERRTERQIARLASLLEPAAILALATMVGTVVLAAVLPLTRLQEVIR